MQESDQEEDTDIDQELDADAVVSEVAPTNIEPQQSQEVSRNQVRCAAAQMCAGITAIQAHVIHCPRGRLTHLLNAEVLPRKWEIDAVLCS